MDNQLVPDDLRRFIVTSKTLFNGGQIVFRFPNGYGASVIRHLGSYGHREGKFELGVVKFTGPGNDDWELCYDTPVTEYVIGHLTPEEAKDIARQVMVLPPHQEGRLIE